MLENILPRAKIIHEFAAVATPNTGALIGECIELSGDQAQTSNNGTSRKGFHLKTKLNVGCGLDIKSDYINLDVASLPGVDIVHDLSKFPWPFPDNSFQEIQLINVLEHLPDTISTIEELHRIAAPNAKVIIRVPFWNSPDMLNDPTHKRSFNENTLNFFDPSLPECRSRPYYSFARFTIEKKICYTRCIVYFKIENILATRLLFFFARFLGAIVWVVEFNILAVKQSNIPK